MSLSHTQQREQLWLLRREGGRDGGKLVILDDINHTHTEIMKHTDDLMPRRDESKINDCRNAERNHPVKYRIDIKANIYQNETPIRRL